MNEFAQSKTGTDGVRGSCSSPRERGERRSKRDAAPAGITVCRHSCTPPHRPHPDSRRAFDPAPATPEGRKVVTRTPRRRTNARLCAPHGERCVFVTVICQTYSETVPLTLKDEQRGSRKRTPVCVWSLEWLQNRLGALAASSTLSICSICRSLFPEPSTIA